MFRVLAVIVLEKLTNRTARKMAQAEMELAGVSQDDIWEAMTGKRPSKPTLTFNLAWLAFYIALIITVVTICK